MTGALLVSLSLAALAASGALLAPPRGDLPLVADVLVAVAAALGLAAFVATAIFTVRRARRSGGAVGS